MIKITTLRIWIGASIAWPLFWILVFDSWFFWTPVGLFVTLGFPIIGWLLWWKYYEGNGEKLLAEGKLALAKSTIALNKMKKQVARKRASNQ
ncbi:MAG: hypothetical protein OEU50_18405 [Gammaproteobacteria bacterium]|nr:hypothetical protein [Gammaproteobacteria bacterium]